MKWYFSNFLLCGIKIDLVTFFLKKARILSRVEGIRKRQGSNGFSEFPFDLESELRDELLSILRQEELFWLIKSRHNWMVEWDRYISYFHKSVLVSRKCNRIISLNVRCEILSLTQFFFVIILEVILSIYSPLPKDHLNCCGRLRTLISSSYTGNSISIVRAPCQDEIWGVISKLGSFKPLRPDGYHPFFYKKYWDIGRRICICLLRIFFPLSRSLWISIPPNLCSFLKSIIQLLFLGSVQSVCVTRFIR